MQESRQWQWMVDGSPASLQAAGIALTIEYKGYTATVVVAEEENSEEGRYFWHIGEGEDTLAGFFDTGDIAKSINAIFVEITRRHTERQTLERASEQAIQDLCDVIDGLNEYHHR